MSNFDDLLISISVNVENMLSSQFTLAKSDFNTYANLLKSFPNSFQANPLYHNEKVSFQHTSYFISKGIKITTDGQVK